MYRDQNGKDGVQVPLLARRMSVYNIIIERKESTTSLHTRSPDYCIAGTFGGDFNLVIGRGIVNYKIHQY